MRAAVPAAPGTLEYDPDDEALLLGTGRISPVPAGAWEFRVGGVRMLELWFGRRASSDEADGLEAIRPRGWPQEWTSELLELITVLALLTELRPRQQALTEGPQLTAGDLRAAWLSCRWRRRPACPASVLDHQEEGPDGQFALL